MIFHFNPGESPLHRTDVRVKLIGMISLSLLLLSVSVFRLVSLLPFLLTLHISIRKESGKTEISPLLMIMPLIIFTGNFLSLGSTGRGLLFFALETALLRTFRFVFILWMAHLFTISTDPMTITPALYGFLKYIPLLPAARLSTQMGLSLTLIPLMLDEMTEIRDAMRSRCGWSPLRPLKNIFHMGLPLLDGVLAKAESLSDAMESRLYNEEATEPEGLSNSSTLVHTLILFVLILFILLTERLIKADYGLIRFY
jgi:energy-coupling factor transporter transmembrane protein EcfT